MKKVKLKKVDFLFVYENKNRELENICLLAHELRKRGYSVYMVETWHAIYHYEWPVDAKVVIAFALYDDKTFSFIASHVYKMRKVINLQWEQVFSKKQELKLIKDSQACGRAREAMYISWGKNNLKYLTKSCGIAPDHIEITGHMALDFFRPELSGYYLSRKELEKKYPVIKGRKVYIFISSFSMTALPKDYMLSDVMTKTYEDPLLLQKLQIQSQGKILEWVKKELVNHPDILFIYRPHPSEINSIAVLRMAKEIPNFVIIQEESVQQWILTADKIYTQISTSIAQIYAAKKNCVLLQPYPLPEELDMFLYDGCHVISTFKEFKEDFVGKAKSFPIASERIQEYYSINETVPSYMRICDICERVYKDDRFTIKNYPCQHPLIGKARIRKEISNKCHILLGNLMRYPAFVCAIGKISPKLKKRGEYALQVLTIENKNYSSIDEIHEIEKRIAENLS